MKCTGFKKNTVIRTTRDSVSSSVSASMTQILKPDSNRWTEVVLKTSKEEKVVAGKQCLVSSNRPSRLLKPKHEGLTMKMLRKASKFLSSLRWKPKPLKSTLDRIGQRKLS